MAVPVPQLIAPGVHVLTLGRGAAASNVYLVGSGATWTLIDTAWAGSTTVIRTAAASLFGDARSSGRTCSAADDALGPHR
jgi:hypothetical protein